MSVEISTQTVFTDGFFTKEVVHVKAGLKRCPFCGNAAKFEHSDTEDGDELIRVYCPECGVRHKLCTSYDDAVKLWNMRYAGK